MVSFIIPVTHVFFDFTLMIQISLQNPTSLGILQTESCKASKCGEYKDQRGFLLCGSKPISITCLNLVLFSVLAEAFLHKNCCSRPFKDISLAVSVIQYFLWGILWIRVTQIGCLTHERTKPCFMSTAVANKLTNPLIHPGKGLPVS